MQSCLPKAAIESVKGTAKPNRIEQAWSQVAGIVFADIDLHNVVGRTS